MKRFASHLSKLLSIFYSQIFFFLSYWILKPSVRFSISIFFVFIVTQCFYSYNSNLIVFAASDNSSSYAMDEGPNWSLDLNQAPPVLFEQTIKVNNQIFTIPLEQTEINEIMNRLPKEELKSIIGEDSIRHPINEFTAQQQANLMDLAILHFQLKNKLIAEMKSLYPEHEWDFVQLIRDKFFFGRQRDREYSCETLSKMLSALQSQKKAASCAKRFRFEILNNHWKD